MRGADGLCLSIPPRDRATANDLLPGCGRAFANTGDAPGLLAAINASQAVEAQKQASVQRH